MTAIQFGEVPFFFFSPLPQPIPLINDLHMFKHFLGQSVFTKGYKNLNTK
jgi:hypothetical protein